MNPAIIVDAWLSGRSATYVDSCRDTLRKFTRFLKESDENFPGMDMIEIPVFAYVCQVKPYQIRQWHEWLTQQVSTVTKKPYSDGFIAAKVRQLSSFYSFLEVNNYIEVHPMRRAGIRLKEPRPVRQQPALTEEQVRKLFAGINTRYQDGIRDYAIMALLFGAGMRIGEITKLRIGDVRKLEGGITAVMLWHTKSGENRLHSVAKWVAASLDAWLEIRAKMGGKTEDSLFGVGDCFARRRFKWYAKMAGMPEISTHSGRRTAITKLLREGVPHRQVQEFSRHASVQLVERYDDEINRPERNPGISLEYSGVNPRQFRLVKELVPVAEQARADEDVH